MGWATPTSLAGTAALIKRKDRQRRAGDQLIALSSYVITWTVTVLAGEGARTVLSGQLADVYLANATRTSQPSSSTHYYLVMNLSRRGILKAGLAAGAVASTSARGPGDRVFQPGSSPYLRPAAGGLPSRVFGTYWPSWDGPALRSLPSAYNTVWLFAAVPVGGPPGTTGAVYWSQSRENTTQFNTDLAALRASGRCVLLSVGGAGSYIQLDTRARSDAFVASVKSIYAQLGGFDGIDFDIEGGTVWPEKLVYISRALKSAYGSVFAVTFPSAPWSSADRDACSALYAAGVLDLVAPQYYSLTGLSAETDKISNAIDSVETAWIPLVGGEASKVGLGYGLASVVSETMTLASFSTVWTTLAAKYPQLRGAFCWEAAADAAESWSFSTTFGSLIAG